MIEGVPGYWMNETTGVLRPVIEAYLTDRPMTDEQIAAMRAYLRQWIFADGYVGEDVELLRGLIDQLTTRGAITAWLDFADECGIDPL